MAAPRPLAGTRIAITRPAGTAGAMARAVRGLGGTPLLLPGSSLRTAPDPDLARAALVAALACEVVIFTSPAAVRFARRLAPLHSDAAILAPGAGTRRALLRGGLTQAQAPRREDSEGILALEALDRVRGRRVGIVGAVGGRGLLARELARHGATILHAHVYQRLPARLDRRHAQSLLLGAWAAPLYVLLSSVSALASVRKGLPVDAYQAMLKGSAVVSSERLMAAAREAGFARLIRARSARATALLAAVRADRA